MRSALVPFPEDSKDFGLRVGVHTSIAGALVNAVHHAKEIGCDTFQIFSANPRGWKAREPTETQYEDFRAERAASGLGPLVIHDNYLINLASADRSIREKSVAAFRKEIRRARALSADYLVMHPGSAKGGTVGSAIRLCAESMKKAAEGLTLDGLTILVENTAGQGSTLGGSFEEVAEILSLVDELPLGVCLDTAHCFEAGYPIHTRQGLAETLGKAGSTFGVERVRTVHANDSKTPFGSHSDRHEHIGKGHIGLAAFRRIVNHPALKDLPFICETPLDEPGDDKRNIRTLRKLAGQSPSPARRRPRRGSHKSGKS